MKRSWQVMFMLVLTGLVMVLAKTPTPCASAFMQEPTVLRELHGVRLKMSRDDVRKQLRKPNQTTPQMDEFKLEDQDLLTVHYGANGLVKTIQLYCTDAKRAPSWTTVIGDAEIEERENGSKFARKVIRAEAFWVTMYQSKSGEVTTITISRQDS